MTHANTGTKFAIGQPVPRSEDPTLVRGEGRFTDDVSVPGQAYAVIVRSRHAHGVIHKIDTDGARKMQGVLGVYTAADLAAGYGTLKCIVPFKNRDGSEMKKPPRRRSRPTRCASSAIRSPSWWRRRCNQAKDAAEAVEVDIDPLPAVTDPEQAVHADAPQLYDDVPGNVALDYHYGDTRGGEGRLRQGRACHQTQDRQQPRGGERHGAARGGRRHENGRFTLHTARRACSA